MYQFEGDSVNSLCYQGFKLLSEKGEDFKSDKGNTKVLRYVTTKLTNPEMRYLFLPGRNNSIAAAIAETFWVLSGNTIVDGWLSRFLHRAKIYSDDGYSWYRGYGQSLYKNNQLAGVIKYLLESPNTRQAVLSLYDPNEESYDNVKYNLGTTQAKDKSCNHQLYFTTQNGKLNLTVTNRSNDVIYGAYSINAFEFTFIQEMVGAYLNAVDPFNFGFYLGDYVVFSNNYHVYLSKDIDESLGNSLAETQFNNVLANTNLNKIDNTTGQYKGKLPNLFQGNTRFKDMNPDEYVQFMRKFFKELIKSLDKPYTAMIDYYTTSMSVLRKFQLDHFVLLKDYVLILIYELVRQYHKSQGSLDSELAKDELSGVTDFMKNDSLRSIFSYNKLFCPIN